MAKGSLLSWSLAGDPIFLLLAVEYSAGGRRLCPELHVTKEPSLCLIDASGYRGAPLRRRMHDNPTSLLY